MRPSGWGPPPFSWPGVIGLVLALSLGLGWCCTLVLSAFGITPPLTEDATDLLNGIGQVLAGAVATFIGSSITTQADHRPHGSVAHPDEPDPVSAGSTPPDEISTPEGPPMGLRRDQ